MNENTDILVRRGNWTMVGLMTKTSNDLPTLPSYLLLLIPSIDFEGDRKRNRIETMSATNSRLVQLFVYENGKTPTYLPTFRSCVLIMPLQSSQ